MSKPLTDLISIETLDADGALREQAEAAGTTRAGLFRKAGIAGGSLVASGVLFGGLPALANAAPSRRQDVAILNYALTLEYLEAAFYKEAVEQGGFRGHVGAFARLVAADEAAHVAYLKRALGRAAVRTPRFDFGNTTSDERTFVATAFALENTGVEAYAGQATRIKQAPVVAAAVSVLTVEARHAAAIAVIAGRITGRNGITPDGPFDRPASMRQVLRIVRGTGFITG